MSAVGTGELLFRLAVAALALAGPTVLYLGLWRFLEWLRDDALIDRLAARRAVEKPRPAAADVLASATAGVDGRRCPACGTTVIAGATRCGNCQAEVGEAEA
jgi:hypothetical protein